MTRGVERRGIRKRVRVGMTKREVEQLPGRGAQQEDHETRGRCPTAKTGGSTAMCPVSLAPGPDNRSHVVYFRQRRPSRPAPVSQPREVECAGAAQQGDEADEAERIGARSLSPVLGGLSRRWAEASGMHYDPDKPVDAAEWLALDEGEQQLIVERYPQAPAGSRLPSPTRPRHHSCRS